MGTIDQKTYTLTCQNCHKVEKGKVLDKGSSFGGSSWQSKVDFINFDVKWVGGGISEPEIISANCKKCKGISNVTTAY